MTTLEDRFSAVIEAQDQTDIVSAVQAFAHAHGFAYGSALYVAEGVTLALPETNERVGQGWLSRSFHKGTAFVAMSIVNEEFIPLYGDIHVPDPVMERARITSMPMVWNQEFYEKNGAAESYELMKAYGMKNGIITALHLPNHEHFVVGFDGPDATPTGRVALTSLMAELQLWCNAAVTPCRSLLMEPSLAKPDQYALTARELEVLRWSAMGKTASEIAQIIGVSHSMAVKHLASVMKQMDCGSIRAAVAKALRINLIR